MRPHAKQTSQLVTFAASFFSQGFLHFLSLFWGAYIYLYNEEYN